MLRSAIRGTLAGAAAGAVGTTALNAVTYADMAIRGRGSSDTPARAVETAASRANVTIPGSDETRANRLSGFGALAGIGAGLAVGAACGAARALGWAPPWPVTGLIAGAAAMAAVDGPLVALGVTDPRQWSAADWASDAVPHAAYGLATAAALAALTQCAAQGTRGRQGRWR